MPKITDLPTDTTPAGSDIIPFVDVDAARTESVTVDNLAASAAFSGAYAPSVLDEDDFASDSATRPPSQQSVAAYAAATFAPLAAMVKPVVSRALPMLHHAGEATSSDETLNQLVTWPIAVPHPVTIDQIGIAIRTGGASCTPRIGLYSPAADGSPGSLLVDAGTVDASTSGAKVVTLGSPVNITTGLVYACVAWQGAVASMRIVRRARPVGGAIDGAGVLTSMSTALASGSPVAYLTASVSGALPSTWPGSTSSGGPANVPALFAMNVSALL